MINSKKGKGKNPNLRLETKLLNAKISFNFLGTKLPNASYLTRS